MNSLFIATFLCLGALASAHYGGHEDGSWKGEGLAESQDHGNYAHGYSTGAYAAGPVHYAGIYAHGAAPIGADGRVVDTPEVAHAKAAHYAAIAGAGHGVHGAYAPLAYAVAPVHYAGHEDGSYKGEGLAESQDNGQYDHGYAAGLYAAAPVHYAGAYAHGAAPIGADGRVVDTPEVAHAKAAHFAAVAGAGHGAHGAYAPLAYAVAPAYVAGHEDGSYKGEGLAESQDNGQYNHAGAYAAAPAYYAGHDDGSYKGEGLAESQDNGQYNHAGAYVAATAHYAGVYTHGSAPLGHDGRVVDTPEVAHAKAAHHAALAAAAHGAHHYGYAH